MLNEKGYDFFKIINGGELHLKILSFLVPILHSSTFFSQLQIEVPRRCLCGTTLKVKKRKPPDKKKNKITSVEGPHGVPSSKTISGTRIILEALKRIQREIEAAQSRLREQGKCEILEHFSSKMRSIYDIPTVQQFFYQFPAALEETLQRISCCGFSCFTSRYSHYDDPDGMFVFKEIQKVPSPVEQRRCGKD